MKKYFKVLGLALLAAGAFAFTSCTEDETEVVLSEKGITVTFGDYTWKAQYIDATTTKTAVIGSRRSFDFFATPNATIPHRDVTVGGEVVDSALCTFPMIYVFGNASGTDDEDQMEVRYLKDRNHAYAATNPTTGFYEFYEWEAGDDLAITVTNFDQSTWTISGTVKGTLHETDSDRSRTGQTENLNVVFKEVHLVDLDAEE